MIIQDLFEEQQSCPHCGGPMFSEMLMMEKKDACYYKVKASAKVWPSAYASGRLVQCRKKGADNYGNKSEGVSEEWSKKYKSSINCSHPKGFSQKAHCAGKKKHNESVETEMTCEDCGMCETHQGHENLDEACWKGYHKEGNKKMFGKTYPNCVKNEGMMEMDKSQTPPGRDGSNDSDAGKKEYTATLTTPGAMARQGGDILNKAFKDSQRVDPRTGKKMNTKGVAEEGERGRGRPMAGDWDPTSGKVGRVEKTSTGVRHHADPSRYGGTEPEHELDTLNKGQVSSMDKALGVKWDRESKRYFSPIKVDMDEGEQQQDVAEGELDEGWKSALGAAALAGTMAMGAGGAHARVMPGDDPGINRLTGKPIATQQATTDTAPVRVDAPSGFSKEYLLKAADPDRFGRFMISIEKAQELLKQMNEGRPKEKEADYGDDYQDMVARVKKLAGLGPLKTVYDPAKRVYRNMPTAQQPKK